MPQGGGSDTGDGASTKTEPIMIDLEESEDDLRLGDTDAESSIGTNGESVANQADVSVDNVSPIRTPHASWQTIANQGPVGMKSPSVVSFASSTGSHGSSVRQRRLPPPPPSSDFIHPGGKRPGSNLGLENVKRGHLEDDTMSVVSTNSVNDRPSQINYRVLESERKKVKFIRAEQDRYVLTYDSLILGRIIEPWDHGTYVDTTFCSRNVLEKLMNIKYKVKKAGSSTYKDLQKRMNDLGRGRIFHFTDAFILANIDSIFNNCVTSPKSVNNDETLIGPNELLYVADIEGQPGGFVEYVLTRKQWEAKVFGFSSDANDCGYSLKGTGHYPKESMEQWLGFSSERGNGDVLNPEFLNKFVAHVRKITAHDGVHVICGNATIEGENIDEDKKELFIKNLALAETLIALRALRRGGNFILKLYDMFTPFTVGLVYLIYRVFDQVSIYKPECSGFAGSDRYVVAQGFQRSGLSIDIARYLESCHQTNYVSPSSTRFSYGDERAEITHLVHLDIIAEARHFFDYVYATNEELGSKQLQETSQILRHIEDDDDYCVEAHRSQIFSKTKSLWGLPDEYRQDDKYKNCSTEETARRLLKPYTESDLSNIERSGESELMYNVMEEELKMPREWHFVHVGRDRGFYLSRGGDKVFRFAGGTWKLVNDTFDLAPNTLIYADIVDEISQYEGKQIVKAGLHIIDAVILGGKDIRDLPYNERMDWCSKYAASMNKYMADRFMLVRAKCPKSLSTIGDSFRDVHKRQILGRGDCKKKPLVPVDCPKFNNVIPEYALTGYLLLRTSNANNSASNFLVTAQNRLYMRINDDSNMDPHGPIQPKPTNPNARKFHVHAATLVSHLQQRNIVGRAK